MSKYAELVDTLRIAARDTDVLLMPGTCVSIADAADAIDALERRLQRILDAVPCAHVIPGAPDGTWRCHIRRAQHGPLPRDHAHENPAWLTDAMKESG